MSKRFEEIQAHTMIGQTLNGKSGTATLYPPRIMSRGREQLFPPNLFFLLQK
jgi:hypothetical protein